MKRPLVFKCKPRRRYGVEIGEFYGIEVCGETTVVGWSETGESEPWTNDRAIAELNKLRNQFVNLGKVPAMRVVRLDAPYQTFRA